MKAPRSDPPQVYRLLMLLREGGAIVRAEDCTAEELAIAKAEERSTLDKDGHGYVWRPPNPKE